LAAILLAAAPAIACAQARLTAEGTELVLTTADGRTMRSGSLVGAKLRIGAPGHEIEVTIASVEEDLRAVGGRVLLHRFEVADRSGKPAALCAPDADGRSLGFPVPDGHGGFDLTCTSGAIGKCIRWGYRPWDEQPRGPPLQAMHRACVHMTRADYGGDGSSATRDGTMISVCDRFGVQPCGPDSPVAFEAAWGVEGATCVARPRIPDIVSLRRLAERHPRLRGRVGPDACNEDAALADAAALLFNRSHPAPEHFSASD
jgi:ADYC domain